jgi:hypothetical protein
VCISKFEQPERCSRNANKLRPKIIWTEKQIIKSRRGSHLSLNLANANAPQGTPQAYRLRNKKPRMCPLEYPFTAMNIFDRKTTMLRKSLRSFLLLALAIPALCAARQDSAPKNQSGKLAEAKLLTAQEAGKLLPDAVFFRGQSAPIQTRNSGGVQFAKGSLFLVALVDTSGYSSSVQEKYQAYLITETPITIENHRLEPGAYGCGFLANNNFIVMDIGGHDLFSVHSTKDADLRRPSPLQVLQSSGGSGYRLYAGRDYVNFMQAP